LAAPIGDPSGIGPEVCVKALATGEPQARSRVLLVGSLETIGEAARACGADVRFRKIASVDEVEANNGAIPVFDPGNLARSDYSVGEASGAGGRASFEWLRLTLDLAEAGAIDACVIGPINRQAFRLAGIFGATDEMHPPDTYQFRVNGPLRIVPITEHIKLRDVPATVTKSAVLRLIVLMDERLRRWGFAAPRLGVAGLNPHCAGEEDAEQIEPAVEEAKQRGIDATGPVSPDAVFRQAAEGRFDAVVSMYHDQGQIAIKTSAFAGACTIFVGLPYVRIGVPHGTAYEIAGTGRAQHLTMLAAMNTAAALASGSGLS
jgi:4-hydroxythreonine-4-phosphate dehydrogenase